MSIGARCFIIYSRHLNWQEWRDSNPQPPVLETGALAIELHSYGAVSCPLPQSGARAHPTFTAATAGNLRGRAWPANRPSYALFASFGGS